MSPLIATQVPYGIRDIKVTPITQASGAYGTFVDVPVGRTLSWTESESFEELRGDDYVQATHGSGPTVDWDLENGGISLAALAVMAGGTVTESGTTPAQKRVYSKTGTTQRPYFLAEGQAINDNLGDTHLVLYLCKATGDIGGEFADGGFHITSCSGQAIPDPNHSGKVWDVVFNETAVAIAQPV